VAARIDHCGEVGVEDLKRPDGVQPREQVRAGAGGRDRPVDPAGARSSGRAQQGQRPQLV